MNTRELIYFQNSSFTFTINVQTKLCSISTAVLPREIYSEHRSIKYQLGSC